MYSTGELISSNVAEHVRTTNFLISMLDSLVEMEILFDFEIPIIMYTMTNRVRTVHGQ